MEYKKKLKAATIQIDDFPEIELVIDDNKLLWEFSPARLSPKKYDLTLKVTFEDNSTQTFKRQIEIFPARVPWENLQICAWNHSKEDLAQSGFSIGGMFNYNIQAIDLNTKNGLYSEINWTFLGSARGDADVDWALSPNGERSFVSIRSPYVRTSVIQEGKRMANLLEYTPSVKMLILNTELHAGSTALDYSPKTVEFIRKNFNLDLNLWKYSDKPQWNLFQPLGYLSTQFFPQFQTKNGVIKDDDSLYSSLRWWHNNKGGSDVITNDLLADEIKKIRPDILTAKEPILRRPSLRSYSNINVAQDWFYYPELSAVVYGAERLNTLTRNSKGEIVASTMPQFLLKSGMAAPFDGMPTVDMFTEATNLVCMRPTRLITFWNSNNAFEQGSNQVTLQDIQNEQDEEKLKKMKLWIPGLKERFQQMSETIWKPLGGFLPQWKNAPRNIAIVESFASHIYGNLRWPNGGFLQQELLANKVPFDVLFDNDLEDKTILKQYDLIILPQIFALTESMVDNLKSAATNGTILVADDTIKTDLPNLKIIPNQSHKDHESLNKKEIELLKKYNYNTDTPAFIEEMEQLSTVTTADYKNSLQEIISELPRTLISTDSKSVFFNILQYGNSSYLAAVNDARVFGKYYGQYGKVRENGIKNQATFSLKSDWKYAYDLLNNREIEFNKSLKLDFIPAELRIIMLTHNPLGELTIHVNDKNTNKRYIPIEISMKNADLVPIEIEIFQSNGEKSDLSCFSVIKNGKSIWNFPLSYNTPSENWRIKIRELATNQTKELFLCLE